MLLIIPAIEIERGKCLRIVRGVHGNISTDDPIEMAKLWRKENAKSLHVTDVDGTNDGILVNFDVIKKMVGSVDIPIELGGELNTFDEIQKAIDIGMYRVTIGPSMIDNPVSLTRAIAAFSASKIVLGIVIPAKKKDDAERAAIATSLKAKEFGIRRIVYTDIIHEPATEHPNYDPIKNLAEKTGMRITVMGGISGLDELLKLQELEPFGIDSVVIGRAMYENKFSCQGIWRLSEEGNYPYTAKV